MPFLSFLDTRAYKPGESVLLAPFGFEFTLKEITYRLWVERGFITDFASIPWAVNWHPSFDVEGPSRAAAIPHDRLYCSRGCIDVDVIDPQSGVVTDRVEARFTRAQCDEIFRQAILDTGRDHFTRHMIDRHYTKAEAALFHAGVRVGGWYYWAKRGDGLRNDYDFVPDDYWSAA